MDFFQVVDNLVFEHGSSEALMQQVTHCIAISDELAHIKPKRDKRKWKECAMSTHYVCLSTSEESNVGSMRLAYDDSYCVIDYLFIVPYARKQGLANKLIQFAQQFAMTDGVRLLLCLSTEDSCSYWMTRGFCLKPNEEDRLNPYNDTYLLSLT